MIPTAFAALLAVTIFQWYTIVQKFWVQPQYLAISFALVALLGGSLADRLVSLLPSPRPRRLARTIAIACLLGGGILFNHTRVDSVLSVVAQQFSWRDSTVFQIGNWFQQHVDAPPGGTVLFDIQAYFEPAVLPNQYHHAGPIRWVDLVQSRPDYFVLTTYGKTHWMGLKMAEQRSSTWDPDYYNMRLYQDLLGTNADKPVPTNDYPFITFVKAFGSEQERVLDQCTPKTLLVNQANLNCFANAFLPGGRGIGVAGPTLWLFKLDYDGLSNSLPLEQVSLGARVSASSSAAEYSPVNVLNKTVRGAWRSFKTGDEAQGEFIGAGFVRRFRPSQLTIRWVATSWLPDAISVEYSDDGKVWKRAGVFDVEPPVDPLKAASGAIVNRWEQKFALPEVGAHSFWRLVAVRVQAGNTFGLEAFWFE
jgi:hypothetical protein